MNRFESNKYAGPNYKYQCVYKVHLTGYLIDLSSLLMSNVDLHVYIDVKSQ